MTTAHFKRLLQSTACVAMIAAAVPAFAEPGITLVGPGNVNGVTDTPNAVGTFDVGGQAHAYHWDGTTQTDLGTLAGDDSSYGNAISGDGTTVVGSSWNGMDARAMYWTNGGSMVALPGLAGADYATAAAVNQDGSVIVGSSNGTALDSQPIRWDNGALTQLGLAGADIYGGAYGVSADGNVVVGMSSNGATGRAVRWSGGTTATVLDTLAGGNYSNASAVSANGNVAVGISNDGANNAHAVRWDGTAVTALGAIAGNAESAASGVSGDGSVIVGRSFGSSSLAFRWDEENGMQDLNTLLSDAGVNMAGIQLEDATAVSQNGEFIAANTGFDGYIVRYDGAGTGGVTTQVAQQAATQTLADQQATMLLESRATANALLGATQPVTQSNHMNVGGMIGSAAGITSGQFANDNIAVLGGVAYGHQDYAGIEQDDAFTFALAGRYMFGHEGETLRPYAEIGGFGTPSQDISFSRTYANGAGTATGVGHTESSSWSGYGRGGLVWQANAMNSVASYIEYGHHTMDYDGYVEAGGPSNPFPATVSSGSVSYDAARLGLSFTHAPKTHRVSFTVSGAVAHAFNMDTDLQANVAGVGLTQAADSTQTWGEFGGQMNFGLTEELSASVGVLGTTGGDDMGTKLHATGGLAYRF